jgi:succinate dehydrogenase / fumarate reductase iron-sulfur subunit
MGNMKLTLKIWRQAGPSAKGAMVDYPVTDISEDMSFLEMLDVLNDTLVREGKGTESPSTTIAAKASAVPAACSLTDVRTARAATSPLANCTCASSRMAM